MSSGKYDAGLGESSSENTTHSINKSASNESAQQFHEIIAVGSAEVPHGVSGSGINQSDMDIGELHGEKDSKISATREGNSVLDSNNGSSFMFENNVPDGRKSESDDPNVSGRLGDKVAYNRSESSRNGSSSAARRRSSIVNLSADQSDASSTEKVFNNSQSGVFANNMGNSRGSVKEMSDLSAETTEGNTERAHSNHAANQFIEGVKGDRRRVKVRKVRRCSRKVRARKQHKISRRTRQVIRSRTAGVKYDVSEVDSSSAHTEARFPNSSSCQLIQGLGGEGENSLSLSVNETTDVTEGHPASGDAPHSRFASMFIKNIRPDEEEYDVESYDGEEEEIIEKSYEEEMYEDDAIREGLIKPDKRGITRDAPDIATIKLRISHFYSSDDETSSELRHHKFTRRNWLLKNEEEELNEFMQGDNKFHDYVPLFIPDKPFDSDEETPSEKLRKENLRCEAKPSKYLYEGAEDELIEVGDYYNEDYGSEISRTEDPLGLHKLRHKGASVKRKQMKREYLDRTVELLKRYNIPFKEHKERPRYVYEVISPDGGFVQKSGKQSKFLTYEEEEDQPSYATQKFVHVEDDVEKVEVVEYQKLSSKLTFPEHSREKNISKKKVRKLKNRRQVSMRSSGLSRRVSEAKSIPSRESVE